MVAAPCGANPVSAEPTNSRSIGLWVASAMSFLLVSEANKFGPRTFTPGFICGNGKGFRGPIHLGCTEAQSSEDENDSNSGVSR